MAERVRVRSLKREREILAAALRRDGKTWVEIAMVLRERYKVNMRAAMRHAHIWSQQQAAQEWNKRWPGELKTFKNFSYWEMWPSPSGHAPSHDVLGRLAQLYQCSAADLLSDYSDYRHLDCARSPANDGTEPSAGRGGPPAALALGVEGWPQDSLDETGTPGDWNDMQRRRLLQSALGIGAGALAPGQLGLPPGYLIDLALTSEPRDLAGWQLAAGDHLHAVRTRPPAQVRDDLLVDLLRLRQQMNVPGADAGLQRALAALATLYANVSTRLGEHGSALRWWQTARQAADTTGDPELRLLVRSTEAGFGLYGQRDPAAILRLLDDAARISGGARSVWRAHLEISRAKALSLLGRHHDAKVTVRAVAVVTPDDAPSGPIPGYWRPDMVHFAESWVHAAAGEEAAADRARDLVLAFGGALDYQYEANVRLHGALCAVAQGGAETGVREAADVLMALTPAHRSRMIGETAKWVLAAVPLDQRRKPAVQELGEALTATLPGSRVLDTGT